MEGDGREIEKRSTEKGKYCYLSEEGPGAPSERLEEAGQATRDRRIR